MFVVPTERAIYQQELKQYLSRDSTAATVFLSTTLTSSKLNYYMSQICSKEIRFDLYGLVNSEDLGKKRKEREGESEREKERDGNIKRDNRNLHKIQDNGTVTHTVLVC